MNGVDILINVQSKKSTILVILRSALEKRDAATRDGTVRDEPFVVWTVICRSLAHLNVAFMVALHKSNGS